MVPPVSISRSILSSFFYRHLKVRRGGKRKTLVASVGINQVWIRNNQTNGSPCQTNMAHSCSLALDFRATWSTAMFPWAASAAQSRHFLNHPKGSFKNLTLRKGQTKRTGFESKKKKKIIQFYGKAEEFICQSAIENSLGNRLLKPLD